MTEKEEMRWSSLTAPIFSLASFMLGISLSQASLLPPPPTSLLSLGPQSQPQACHLLASDLGKAPASSSPTCAEGLAALFMAF